MAILVNPGMTPEGGFPSGSSGLAGVKTLSSMMVDLPFASRPVLCSVFKLDSAVNGLRTRYHPPGSRHSHVASNLRVLLIWGTYRPVYIDGECSVNKGRCSHVDSKRRHTHPPSAPNGSVTEYRG